MKKKDIKSIYSKSTKELRDEVEKLRTQIARAKLERAHNAPKDTNTLQKLKKRLAIVLTILNEHKD